MYNHSDIPEGGVISDYFKVKVNWLARKTNSILLRLLKTTNQKTNFILWYQTLLLVKNCPLIEKDYPQQLPIQPVQYYLLYLSVLFWPHSWPLSSVFVNIKITFVETFFKINSVNALKKILLLESVVHLSLKD